MPGVRVVGLCDVDPAILAERETSAKTTVPAVFTTTDARRLFSRTDLDAVIIASPNHWHALHSVWA